MRDNRLKVEGRRLKDENRRSDLSAIGFASGAPGGSRATLLRRVGRGSDVGGRYGEGISIGEEVETGRMRRNR